ncbi:hypothetical protein PILCRDRAFT_827295 [Piloderma croceum F 1598]|uniref:Ribosomal protein S16 n=1 Tax=Piloderma croceum (strain F 1598) TaxID=765440 RepID=A0A0C3F5S9_PILCF|nr:hypothetical protein PILCRDRAFT_827295 [Piloderma croceum F 1598]
MPVRIRLAMHGRRHKHFFHLVVINSRKARDAKPMETLGIYDPSMTLDEKHKTVEWSVNRIKYWLGVGATPSKTVVRLLEMGGVIPPDSKYHPKALGPRVPLPTVPLDSLKARTLWESLSDQISHSTSDGQKEETSRSEEAYGNRETISSEPSSTTASASLPS